MLVHPALLVTPSCTCVFFLRVPPCLHVLMHIHPALPSHRLLTLCAFFLHLQPCLRVHRARTSCTATALPSRTVVHTSCVTATPSHANRAFVSRCASRQRALAPMHVLPASQSPRLHERHARSSYAASNGTPRVPMLSPRITGSARLVRVSLRASCTSLCALCACASCALCASCTVLPLWLQTSK